MKPPDYPALRRSMTALQIRARGFTDERVLRVMEEVPRHRFVPDAFLSQAYDDGPLPIGDGQTISQPYMVAVMTGLLDLRGNERVLELGTGSGYQAAVLSRLCKWVFTIERIPGLSEKAKAILTELACDNISYRVGDGTRGCPSHAPFDGIIVTAGAPSPPVVLLEQLVEGGRLIIPVGDRFAQTLKKLVKTGSGVTEESHTDCRFVDLIGEFGWAER